MGLMKLDSSLVGNRMRWKSTSEEPATKPRYTGDYTGVYASAEIPEDKLDLVVNQRVSLTLDCSVAPLAGYYAGLVVPNPKLHEYFEVSGTSVVIPGSERIVPVIHLRALRTVRLRDFDYLATLHLLD